MSRCHGGAGAAGRLRPLLAAAAVAAAAQTPAVRTDVSHFGATKKLFVDATKVMSGCYFLDRRYYAKITEKFIEADYLACQRRCQTTTNCAFFGFWENSRSCFLAGGDAVFTSAGAQGAIAGPRECPQIPAGCTEVPNKDFPGATKEESQLAWPSHRVPEKLECWPQNTSGGFYDSCPIVTTLEDTRSDWPGLCTGLKQVLVPWGQTCESYCKRKVSCSVYQVLNNRAKSCMHSKLYGGAECYMGNPDTQVTRPLEAKRFMHGRVRVLADLVGVQILGLQRAFDENYFLNVSRDAVPACRNNCYSNVGCQWWQYSRKSGCWVEDPRMPVEFPMTTKNWRTGTDFASMVIGGEYIQHICQASSGGESGVPAGATTTVAAVTSLPRDVAPIGTLQGQLIIHGLYFGSLTEAQKKSLGDDYTESIASALGLPKSWIRDETGVPGQVSLSSGGGGTQADFLIDVPPGMSNNDVRRALLEHKFIDRVKSDTRRLAGHGGEGGESPSAFAVETHVLETTPPPNTFPETTPAPSRGGVPWWVLSFAAPALLACCLAAFCLWYGRSKLAGSGVSGKKPPNSPRRSPSKPKGRLPRQEQPLLDSPPKNLSQDSERELYGAEAAPSGSSQPPPSPYREDEDSQRNPLLADSFESPQLVQFEDRSALAPAPPLPGQGCRAGGQLPGNEHVLLQAPGVPPGVLEVGSSPSTARLDPQLVKSSVLNAAFDIIDANKDGVVSPSEFARYDYGPATVRPAGAAAATARPMAAPAALPPALMQPPPALGVASLGPQPATARPVAGLRRPSLASAASLTLPPGPALAPRPATLPAQAVLMPTPPTVQGAPFAFRR